MIGILIFSVMICLGAGVYFALRTGNQAVINQVLTPDARLSMYFMGAACALSAIALQVMMVTAGMPELIPLIVFCAFGAIWIWKRVSQG